MKINLIAGSAEEMFALGKKMGMLLKGGEVICLRGELGAGKTVFVQGVGEALGILENITSPTFTLMQEYSGRSNGEMVKMVHMDLYRLKYPEEVEIIGVSDAFTKENICLIEWPEISEDYLPEDALDVVIIGSGEEPRKVQFSFSHGEWEDILRKFR